MSQNFEKIHPGVLISCIQGNTKENIYYLYHDDWDKAVSLGLIQPSNDFYLTDEGKKYLVAHYGPMYQIDSNFDYED